MGLFRGLSDSDTLSVPFLSCHIFLWDLGMRDPSSSALTRNATLDTARSRRQGQAVHALGEGQLPGLRREGRAGSGLARPLWLTAPHLSSVFSPESPTSHISLSSPSFILFTKWLFSSTCPEFSSRRSRGMRCQQRQGHGMELLRFSLHVGPQGPWRPTRSRASRPQAGFRPCPLSPPPPAGLPPCCSSLFYLF